MLKIDLLMFFFNIVYSPLFLFIIFPYISFEGNSDVSTGRNGTLINSWSNNVVDLLSSYQGLAYLWNIRNVSLPSLNTVIQRIRIGTTKLGL